MRIDCLIEAIERTGNPTALGLDTRVEFLPPSLAGFPTGRSVGSVRDEGDAEAVCSSMYAFNCALIDALADIVPCVKAQVACYEMLGVPGVRLFRDTLLYARQKCMITIADVKRNDIGITSGAYAAAYLEENSPLSADFITVNPYLGTDGMAPFLDACGKNGSGIFVLVRTSNPSAGEFQDLIVQDGEGKGRPLYEHVGQKVAEWGGNLTGRHGYSSVGAVVGATCPEEGKKLRALLPGTFFLVPGYGAQGATAQDLVGCFDGQGRGAVVNASRSLLCAYKKRNTDDFISAARDEALHMREELRAAIKNRHGVS
ncbi:MAG: orotidine-5'-phosphate decarboxylase [Synergistaceae bacterium]|jgi:orotidine-5'-phosphate decarboxylase|nr:orotidine-5'-phosphate decarboxylase [Synergistaceae bacterium]